MVQDRVTLLEAAIPWFRRMETTVGIVVTPFQIALAIMVGAMLLSWHLTQ